MNMQPMQSIERINGGEVHDSVLSEGVYLATMREFLARPRVARDFQDLKADAQKLRALERERTALEAGSAEAELEAARRARAKDEHRQHRLSFATGVIVATLFVALDAFPANLAAQTFGLGPLPTWGITAVIVGALAAGMWAVTHYKSGWRRGVTIGALALGLLAIGALRYVFLWVTADDPLSAILEAAALTVFTTMMVWLGALVLGFTKSRNVSAAEARAHRLHRRAERKGNEERQLTRHMEAAKAEFFGDAQLHSFRSFSQDAPRNQFLEYVRAELER
jgi:hypothetical protein